MTSRELHEIFTDECYDCGQSPTVATDTDIDERYCESCTAYHESCGDEITRDGGQS